MGVILEFPARQKPVQGLTPVLVRAEEIGEEGSWLVCGLCGFQGSPTHYRYVNEPWCFEGVCNCPLPAILEA